MSKYILCVLLSSLLECLHIVLTCNVISFFLHSQVFKFDKHYYNVLEVNDTSYQLCNDQNFITNITRGGRDVFNLTQARPYYFLSGGGYCFQGMKLAVNVEEYVPPPVAPPPSKNGVYITTAIQNTITIALEIALLLAFLLKWY